MEMWGEVVEMESGSWEKGQSCGCRFANHTIVVLYSHRTGKNT